MRAWFSALDRRSSGSVSSLGWSYLGVMVVLPFSILVSVYTDLPTIVSVAIGLGFGVIGQLLGTRVLRPVYHAYRSRSIVEDPQAAEAVREAALAYFLQGGQDPLRAEISAASLVDAARKLGRTSQ